MNTEVAPLATPGIHESFFDFFLSSVAGDKSIRILELGAGHGAFSKRLHDNGFNVVACDIDKNKWKLEGVEFSELDATGKLPYSNDTFDVVLMLEVMEHLIDHEQTFKECWRILKPNGKLLISTPNILSLKSRFRYLFTGFFYSFIPMDTTNFDGMQHISSMTFDQYRYIAKKHSFDVLSIGVDKYQLTSMLLLVFFPLLYLFSKLRKIDFNVHNNIKLLLGRTLFMCFSKS